MGAANEDEKGLLRDPCQVRVHLIEVRGLKGTGFLMDGATTALPNPLAKVQLSAGSVKRMQATEMFQATSSVYFDETKIFNEMLSKDEFQDGSVTVQIEDDQGFFCNSLIGEAMLDLTDVHDSPGHEVFGKWLPLLNPAQGSVLQGFLRVCVSVLRDGEQPKPHADEDLAEEADGDLSLVLRMPEIRSEALQLTVRIYRAEVAHFMQPRPDAYFRVRFAGTKECRSRVVSTCTTLTPTPTMARRAARTPLNAHPDHGQVSGTYIPMFNDQLCLPIYTPTLSDTVLIELIEP